MFILDTNVVSELMRPAPEPALKSWVADRAASSMFLTSVCEAELRFGLATMPSGRRRDGLAANFEWMLRAGFANRVLPFDSAAARAYAEIASGRRAAGHSISQFDGQIAAIARARGMALATRNVGDFRNIGLVLVNPWAGA